MATAFLHYQTTRTQLGRAVQWFPFLLQFKYFSDILRTSGRTPDVRLCTMAVAFLYHRTTCAQLGRVFRCFSFHNISLDLTVSDDDSAYKSSEDIIPSSLLPPEPSATDIDDAREDLDPSRTVLLAPFLLPDLFSLLPCLSN